MQGLWRSVVLSCVVIAGSGGFGASLLACRGEPPPTRTPDSPVTDHRIQIPDGMTAMLDVELAPVRNGVLGSLLHRAVDRFSSLSSSCRPLLDRAERATVAVRFNKTGMTIFAIVRGIDRASTLACLQLGLRAKPRTASEWSADAQPIVYDPPVAASPPAIKPPSACHRFDRAVRTLAACERIPRSLALSTVQHDLVNAAPGDDEAACGRAVGAIEQAVARRRQLGGTCEPKPKERSPRDPAARPFFDVTQIDPRTYALDGEELVRFVDDTTLVSVRADGRHADDEDLPADLAAMFVAAPAPRWYDGARAARDPSHPIWLMIDPTKLFDDDPDDPPASRYGRKRLPMPRMFGTVDVSHDVLLDLQILGARSGHVETVAPMLQNALADPSFHGASVSAECRAPAPTGPRVARCAQVIERMQELLPDRTPSTDTLMGAIGAYGSLADCVDGRGWPDSQLACFEAANDQAAAQKCVITRHLDSLDDYRAEPLCNDHPVRLRVGLPLVLVESLKLEELVDLPTIEDCDPEPELLPYTLWVGPVTTESGRPLPFAATGCTLLQCGRPLDLDPSFTGPDDARWHLSGSGPSECHVPSLIRAADDEPSNLPDLSSTSCDTYATLDWKAKPKVAELCLPNRGPKACTSLPLAVKPREIAIDAEARYAALVVGAPGALTIETWDLQTHERIGRFAAGTTPQRPCARVAMLEDRVLVDTGACEDVAWLATKAPAPPPIRILSDHATLTTLQGKRIARIGGAQPLATVRRLPVAVGDHRWAFVAAQGDTVVIQNIATGAVERTIATHAQVEPGLVTSGGDGAGHVVLRFAGTTPFAGGTTVIDANGGDVRAIAPLPRCPAPKQP